LACRRHTVKGLDIKAEGLTKLESGTGMHRATLI
jgi:hypothetical protein